MIKDLTVVVSCEECRKEIDLEDEGNTYCDKCNENSTDILDIKQALIYSAKQEEWIPSDETDITYIDEPEKRKIFFKGMKRGYASALFWLSDYFGDEMVKFFEDKIGHRFENMNNKEEDK